MLTIGQMSKASGCKIQAIRYYEQIGLIRCKQRSEDSQRVYKESDIDKLQFIRHARSLGFPIEMIKALLLLQNHPKMSCEAIDNIAREHLSNVKKRIVQLEKVVTELEGMLNDCKHKDIANSNILKVLHEHTEFADHQPLDL